MNPGTFSRFQKSGLFSFPVPFSFSILQGAIVEQRKHLRFPVNFHSSFSSVGMVRGTGSVVDLSIRGCRIESLIDVQPGSSLEVRIEAVAHELPIHIQAAIVRWSRGREFGLEFEVIAPTEWVHLQDIVRQIEMAPDKRDTQAAGPGESM
jgi:hypothetical protein